MAVARGDGGDGGEDGGFMSQLTMLLMLYISSKNVILTLCAKFTNKGKSEDVKLWAGTLSK